MRKVGQHDCKRESIVCVSWTNEKRDLPSSRIPTAVAWPAVLVVAATVGCSNGSETLLTGPASRYPPPQVPTAQARTLTVVSGWDNTPVPGAQVRVNDAPAVVDVNGQFVCSETAPSEAPIDVDAPGFLPHRTRLFSVPATNLIALWPVVNEADAAAIRAMVFYERNGEFRMSRLDWREYYLALLVDGVPQAGEEIAAQWRREYEEIEALTGLRLSVSFAPRADTEGFEEEVVVAFGGTEDSCRDSWGFCVFPIPNIPYFSRPVRIAPPLASRPDVIRRVLVSGLLLANPQPGLLNKAKPAAELSLLEKQTLRMQHLRPAETRWPDTAPVR